MNKTISQILKDMRQLLDSLDAAVQTDAGVAARTVDGGNQYAGCAGGLAQLLDQSYFDIPRTKGEVTAKLVEVGRHYPAQLVSMNLLNLYKTRVLVRIGTRGAYKYVIRK